MVRTTSYDQAEILKNILKLHVPDGVIDCDPCYSKGNFYENTGITAPRYKFDIEPQSEDVVFADCRNLPLADNSLNCIMFDPPFLATTGKSLYSNEGNIITNASESIRLKRNCISSMQTVCVSFTEYCEKTEF